MSFKEEYEKLEAQKKPFKEWLNKNYVEFVKNYLNEFPADPLTTDHKKDTEVAIREQIIAYCVEEFLFERFLAQLKVLEPTEYFIKTVFAYAAQLSEFGISQTEKKLDSDLKLSEIVAASIRNLKSDTDVN